MGGDGLWWVGVCLQEIVNRRGRAGEGGEQHVRMANDEWRMADGGLGLSDPDQGTFGVEQAHGEVIAAGVHLQCQAIPRAQEGAGDGDVGDLRVGVQVSGGLAVIGAVEETHHVLLRPDDEVVAKVADNVGNQENEQ
nr:hypothetical protein [Anaerolineae bacterium]